LTSQVRESRKFPKTAKEFAEKGHSARPRARRLKSNTTIFVIPTPNAAEESYSPQLRVLFEHVVCADGHSLTAPIDACHGSDHALSDIADSSAAFGVGMTRAREQGDAESLSANRKNVQRQ
jgi:hypothetical protein